MANRTRDNGFPPRPVSQEALLLLIAEQGGTIRTQDRERGWSVYAALADRLNLSPEARTRRTSSDPRPAWRHEVGYCRKNLVDAGYLEHNDQSGEGIWRLTAAGLTRARQLSPPPAHFPEEVPAAGGYPEGAVIRVLVNRYERSPEARQQCIEAHGAVCCVCGFSFGAEYGPEADGYIHVHHVRPLSEIGGTYAVDPVEDLRPVCPNCHAVLHLGGRCRSIEEVRQLRAQRRQAEPGAAADRRGTMGLPDS